MTDKQNDDWIDSLARLPLDRKLKAINERILNDTNVFLRRSCTDGIKATEETGNKVYGESKPTFAVNETPLVMDNMTPNNKVVALTQLLNTNNIEDIIIYRGTDKSTLALFGTNGRHGVIIMKLTNKKYISKFKQLKLTSN